MFLDLVGFTMVFVDIQFRAEDLGAHGWMIGGILASTFILQTIFSPLWGRWSDRIGRKTAFILCTSLSALSILVYGLAGNLWMILLSRMLAGLGGANVAVAQASLADQSHPDERKTVLGRLGAAQMAGMVAGPAIGGFVATHLGTPAVGFIGSAASAYGVLMVLLFADLRGGEPVYNKRPFGFTPLFKQFPRLVPLVILAAVAWFSLSCLEGTFGRLIEHQWGLGQAEFGAIFAFESVVGMAAQGAVLPMLAKYAADRNLLSGGFLFQGVGLALMPFVHHVFAFPVIVSLFGASFLYAGGQGVANTTLNALASNAVDESSQGELFGVLHSARSIGFVFGPVLGGILFDWHPAVPYVFAGFVCLAASAMVLRVVPHHKPQTAEQAP